MSFERTDFPFPDDNPNETPAAGASADTPDDAPELVEPEPPKIVAETPVGGQARPVIGPPQPDAPGESPTPGDVEPPAIKSETETLSEDEAESSEDAQPDDALSPEDAAPESDLPAVEGIEVAKVVETVESEPESDSAPAAVEEPPAPAERRDPPTLPSRPTEPKPMPAVKEKIKKKEDWDDDLSPELAAILFGGGDDKDDEEKAEPPADEAIRREPPAPTATRSAALTASPTPARATPPVTAPSTEPRPAAQPTAAPDPVHLTDLAAARTEPISAEGVRAAAPESRPESKARYVRIEEPLNNDQGQRVSETWDYRGPELPKLNGRELRTVKIEEITYADGSWKWRFERKYTDRGYDRRLVRANADCSYIERRDEINAPDDLAGKRVKRREEDPMLLASPAKTRPQRSFFSRLLGRGAQHDEPAGERSWRTATPDEIKHARRSGGSAF
jgi:hypothetical protein